MHSLRAQGEIIAAALVIAVPIMAVMMVLASRPSVMGTHVISPRLRRLGLDEDDDTDQAPEAVVELRTWRNEPVGRYCRPHGRERLRRQTYTEERAAEIYAGLVRRVGHLATSESDLSGPLAA